MLRSLLSNVLRGGARGGNPVSSGARGHGSSGHSGANDPGSAVGAAVGRSLFSRLRRR